MVASLWASLWSHAEGTPQSIRSVPLVLQLLSGTPLGAQQVPGGSDLPPGFTRHLVRGNLH